MKDADRFEAYRLAIPIAEPGFLAELLHRIEEEPEWSLRPADKQALFDAIELRLADFANNRREN